MADSPMCARIAGQPHQQRCSHNLVLTVAAAGDREQEKCQRRRRRVRVNSLPRKQQQHPTVSRLTNPDQESTSSDLLLQQSSHHPKT